MHLYASVKDLRNLPTIERESTVMEPIQLVKGTAPYQMFLLEQSVPAVAQAEREKVEMVPVHVILSETAFEQSV